MLSPLSYVQVISFDRVIAFVEINRRKAVPDVEESHRIHREARAGVSLSQMVKTAAVARWTVDAFIWVQSQAKGDLRLYSFRACPKGRFCRLF
ncbi:hypothetical protein [Paenibacillus sp. yr247]|uniref:hypothetical protein n=1 Tax=Paenibacillus sp. yr247 TaxID=1761880 RepID=UPI001587E870|nr:hypothetical protein [Paenibacillus sp. yr247]